MEKQFRVKWEIDVCAETAEEAIELARKHMPHPLNVETTATVFETIEVVDGKFLRGTAQEIDIMEQEYDEERDGDEWSNWM